MTSQNNQDLTPDSIYKYTHLSQIYNNPRQEKRRKKSEQEALSIQKPTLPHKADEKM